jgi:proteic killer suppression protein
MASFDPAPICTGVASAIATFDIGQLMILTFTHKGLERFFETGSKAGINPQHADRLARQLSFLDSATNPKDVDVPG